MSEGIEFSVAWVYRAAEADAAAARVGRLTQAYLTSAWQVYEARRAAREVLWGITALLESARIEEAYGG